MLTLGRRLCLVAVAVCTVLIGCDPCAGTPSCRTGDRVSYTGRVIDHASGQSAPGTVVTFIRTGGVMLVGDTVRSTADGSGFFHLSANASESGDVVGTLNVRPPGRPGYAVNGLTMRTTRVGGDGGDFGRLVAEPYIMFIAEVHSRLRSPSGPLPFATVTFRRTGGISIDSDVINTDTDPAGRFFLAPNARQPGVLEGELTVSAPGLPRSYRVPVQIETRYLDAPTHDVTLINVGSTLLWAGEVYRRVTHERLPGIQVSFQRTGGIAVDPSSFTTTTNNAGLFPIQPTPLADGELIGDVTVIPPAPFAPVVRRGVRVHTVEDDSVRLAVTIGYGPQVLGAVAFLSRTTMTPIDSGAVVVFRRTGGVRTLADSFVDRSNQLGTAKVELASDAVGEVVGDFEVRMGEANGTDVVRGARLASSDDDAQKFAGVYLVGRWFPQIGQVVDSATRKAIPGVRAVFKRVSGVGIRPDPFTVIPNADGYFGLRPQPLGDGDVVGDLTFELPLPYRTFTVPGLRLHPSMDDTLRLIGAWFLAPGK